MIMHDIVITCYLYDHIMIRKFIKLSKRQEHQVTGEAAQDNLQFECCSIKNKIFPHISNAHY